MKPLRVILTAIGYLTMLIGVLFAELKAINWLTENLSFVQFLMAVAVAVLVFCMIPAAKHFTDKGQRWPWEPKR